MLYYVRIKADPAKRRWKVREAVSLEAAFDAITSARVSGSVGAANYITHAIAGPYDTWPKQCQADVVQVNSDNTERQAYTEGY